MKTSSRRFPSRVADLGFAVTLPTDWLAHELPPEDVDFANPTAFATLGIVSAPHAAIVLAFAARPAYDDGTLFDWAGYHLNHNGLEPRALGAHVIAGVAAAVGEAVQASDLGTMVVRFAFFEDGDRLINLSLTAPELLADAVREVWFGALRTFSLETPRGSRFAPSEEVEHAESMAADAGAQHPARVDVVSSPGPTSVAHGNSTRPGQSRLPQFADFALAADTASLEADAPLNVDYRNRGLGRVPDVVAVRSEARYASVASAAIMGQFDVPFGWHVIDDGERALVFDPGEPTQIALKLTPRDGRSNARILDMLEVDVRSRYATPEFSRTREGPIHAMSMRGIDDQAQPRDECYMLYPFRDQSMLLLACVTAPPRSFTAACSLARLVLESCAFDAFQLREDVPRPTEERTGPEWWHAALALEAEGKLEAAEQHIRASCAHIGFAQATAEMYRLRMLRLKSLGDDTGARHAFGKASNYIGMYASMATSGGEGSALSEERDRFRAQLVIDLGVDPEAPS